MRRWVVAVFAGAALLTGSSATGEHKVAHGRPASEATRSFSDDFPIPNDSEWGWPLGGFGGVKGSGAVRFHPVIFIHGNAYDAAFWDVATEAPPSTMNVRAHFRMAGYTDQELWAISYNGRACMNTALCGTANDINVADIAAFIESVRAYTGSQKVDIVAHSLGVTIVRKAIKDRPVLLDRIEDMVLIAGANHGTTSCEGLESTWFGCDEIAPGTSWLADLNSWDPKGEGDETPGPVRYMTIYDGSGTADTFFLGDDAASPALSGADNRELPGTLHLPLARGRESLDIYLPFVKNHNELATAEAQPGGSTGPSPTRAAPLAATGSSSTVWGWFLLVMGVAAAFGRSVVARGLEVE